MPSMVRDSAQVCPVVERAHAARGAVGTLSNERPTSSADCTHRAEIAPPPVLNTYPRSATGRARRINGCESRSLTISSRQRGRHARIFSKILGGVGDAAGQTGGRLRREAPCSLCGT